MVIIEKIEIKNFRSFANIKKEKVATINDAQDINILSGANDSGKSNIIRALNLFFNDEVTPGIKFDFDKDFSRHKEEEQNKQYAERSIKSHIGNTIIVSDENFNDELEEDSDSEYINNKNTRKRTGEISIKIHFKNDDIFKTLPRRFFVLKKYDKRGLKVKEQSNNIVTQYQKQIYKKPFLAEEDINNVTDENKKEDLRKQKNQETNIINNLSGQLTRFLNRIVFRYVPAIKDESYFREYLLSALQEVLNKKSPELNKITKEFENILKKETESLFEKFKTHSGIDASFLVKENMISFDTHINVDTGKILLNHRGDGVQAMFIAAILNEISSYQEEEKNKKFVIWGFEEPENSYEYKNAQKLCEKFLNDYGEKRQIFLTTHSFHFLLMEDTTKVKIARYRIHKDKNDISTIKQTQKNVLIDDIFDSMKEDLGIGRDAEIIDRKLQEALKEIQEREIKETELHNELEAAKQQLNTLTKPTVISEGHNKDYFIHFQQHIHKWQKEGSIQVSDEYVKTIQNLEFRNPAEFGESQIETAHKMAVNTGDTAPYKFYVFDCDAVGCHKNCEERNARYSIPYIFKHNEQNTMIKKGIENLFDEKYFKNTIGKKNSIFYRTQTIKGDYGADIQKEEFLKNEFAKYILDSDDFDTYKNFKPLFDFIVEKTNSVVTQITPMKITFTT
jgi:predicted ATP-dependent endonuclease of OLD family